MRSSSGADLVADPSTLFCYHRCQPSLSDLRGCVMTRFHRVRPLVSAPAARSGCRWPAAVALHGQAERAVRTGAAIRSPEICRPRRSRLVGRRFPPISRWSTARPSSSATAASSRPRRTRRCSPATGCAPSAAASKCCSPTAACSISTSSRRSICSPTRSCVWTAGGSGCRSRAPTIGLDYRVDAAGTTTWIRRAGEYRITVDDRGATIRKFE